MGMVTSSVLFYFWMILTVCGAVQFQSEIRKASDTDSYYSSSYNFLSYMIYYTLIVTQFFLTCFADKPPTHVEDIISKVSIQFLLNLINNIIFNFLLIQKNCGKIIFCD